MVEKKHHKHTQELNNEVQSSAVESSEVQAVIAEAP
jgi:hypothetical protein